MLGRYAKVGVLLLLVVVLVVEGFFVYRWYDRYRGPGGASGAAPAGAPAFEGTAEGTAAEAGTPFGADPDDAFTHTATGANSRGDYTYLDDPRVDGDPNAVVLADPSPARGDAAYGHNIGVWYEPEQQRWAVFNQDLTPVPAGTLFEVVVPPEPGAFVHRAGPANTVGNATYVDDPLTNGDPEAEVSVTQNWNPGGGGGVYNDHPVEVFYDEDVGRWAVYNVDNAAMPEGAAFNVAVPGGEP